MDQLKILKSINKDLKRLRTSDCFDPLYYLTYHPASYRIRFYPYLHYLLFGGFDRYDPSPTFDSSYYLQKYTDVSCSGMNPLIHYLRHGKNEERAPYSPDGGKHFEFLGINGAGKTTLYRQANKYLQHKLGYKPGSTLLWTNIVQDGRYQALIYEVENQSIDCSFNMNELQQQVHTAAKEYQFRTSYIDIIYRYLTVIKLDHAKPWIMFDEGFYNTLAGLVISEEGILSAYSEKILENMPKADLLIHVKADVTRCFKKKNAKPQGFKEISSNKAYRWFFEEIR